MASGEYEIGLRLGAALWPLWDYRGHMFEGQQWIERLLALESPNARASQSIRMKALRVAGWQGFYRLLFGAETNPARPISHFEEALTLARKLGDRRTEASALTGLGAAAVWSGHSSTNQSYLEAGMRLWREPDAVMNGVTALSEPDEFLLTGKRWRRLYHVRLAEGRRRTQRRSRRGSLG